MSTLLRHIPRLFSSSSAKTPPLKLAWSYASWLVSVTTYFCVAHSVGLASAQMMMKPSSSICQGAGISPLRSAIAKRKWCWEEARPLP